MVLKPAQAQPSLFESTSMCSSNHDAWPANLNQLTLPGHHLKGEPRVVLPQAAKGSDGVSGAQAAHLQEPPGDPGQNGQWMGGHLREQLGKMAVQEAGGSWRYNGNN